MTTRHIVDGVFMLTAALVFVFGLAKFLETGQATYYQNQRAIAKVQQS